MRTDFVSRGAQSPRISCTPAYGSSAGRDTIRLAEAAGLVLDEWQQHDLIAGMGESTDWKCPYCVWRSADPSGCPDHPDAALLHPWAAFEVVDVAPRQNGKSELEVARQLGGALIIEEPLQIYSAHLFDTALEIFLRLEQIVLNSDDLCGEVKHRGRKMVGIKHSHGEEGIEFRNGCRIRFKARTGAGGRGFTSDRLAFDEAMILPEAFLGATVPTLSAVPNPQLWFYGSAPDVEDPTHDGVALAKRRRRALAGGDPSLAYFERSADWDGDPSDAPDDVLDDRGQWALANPALGSRISVETVANERRAMGARQFAIERLGIATWPDPAVESDRVIPRDVWDAAAETDPAHRITRAVSFAVDVNPDRTRVSIGVAGQRDDGTWQIAIADYRRGVTDIAGRCVELATANPDSVFYVLGRSHAENLATQLQDAGLRVLEMDQRDYAVGCVDFVDLVTAGTVRYPAPQPELEQAVGGARRGQQVERVWTWSRKASTVDISPLVAVTVALAAARGHTTPQVWNLAELAGLESRPAAPATAPASLPPGFVSLEDMPAQRSVFH